jgi:hypothetical protein
MDWWTAEMTETVVRLALALVAILVTAWGGGLFKLAHQWAAGLKDERIAALAEKLVLAAEQQFGGSSGEAKLNWALEQSWIKKLGVDRADIEAAVKIMNTATAASTPAPDQTTTAELSAATSRIAELEAQLVALASTVPSPVLSAVADQVAAAQTTIGKAQEFAGAIGELPGSVTGAIAHAQELASRLRGGGV